MVKILNLLGGLSIKKVVIGIAVAALIYLSTLVVSFARSAVADRELVVRQKAEISYLITEIETQKVLADQYREAQLIADKTVALTEQQVRNLTKAREHALAAQETDNGTLSSIYRDSLAAIRDSLRRAEDSGSN